MHLKKQRLSALFIITIVLGMIVSTALVAAEKAASNGSPEDVLAEIGDKKITRALFDKELATFLATANPQAAAHFNTAEGKGMFLNQICEIYALEAKAGKLGLNAGEDFEKDFHEIAVARLAQEKMQKSLDAVVVSEEEAKKHYEENKSNYTEPASWHLYQIALPSAEKAAEIKKELDAGKSFLEIAKKESTDDYKDAGGDQGFVPESAISPTVLNTIGQLKKDQVSAPIKLDEETFLLVKYTDKKDGSVKPYETVSAQLQRELESGKQRKVYESEIDQLKKDLSYKLNQDSLELVKKETLTDAEKDTVLFSFAGKDIKVGQLFEELQQIPPFIRPQILGGQGLQDILNNFSSRFLATENAEKNFDALVKEFPEVVEDSKRRVAIRKLLDQKIGSITVDEKEIEDYYNKNLAEFSAPAQISAHHILVKEEATANKLLEELKAEPTKFEELAKANSTCPSGQKGGDLGRFGEGQMVPEFDKACKEAEIGKIVGPVKTQFGYHLVRVNERTPAGTQKLEEVKDQIRSRLLPEKQKAVFTALVDEVKKEFNVKIYQDKL